MLSNIPNWIQAGAAAILTGVTIWTLIVLIGYAGDTKTLAKNSAAQIELNQMPFVALVWVTTPNLGPHWAIQNLGFGPAINVYYSGWRNEKLNLPTAAPPLGVQNLHPISNNSAEISRSALGFTIEYESLAGKKFRTVVTSVGEKQSTKFERI